MIDESVSDDGALWVRGMTNECTVATTTDVVLSRHQARKQLFLSNWAASS